MKIREHKGSLADSLLTVKEIVPTIEAVLKHINESFREDMVNFKKEDIIISSHGYDHRCNWETYLVSLKNCGVFGFINERPM